jgi:hypothetical protein
VKINEATATGDLIVGTTRLSADIFAVQLTVRFWTRSNTRSVLAKRRREWL